MRNVSLNSTCGQIRTPESLLIDAERARFREQVLTAALAALGSDYLRLVIHARYLLGWSQEQVAAEFRVEQSTAQRAEQRGLAILRQQLAARGVSRLSDIL